ELDIELTTIEDQWHVVLERPWTEGQYPHFAKWLKLNEKPLAAVIEATKRNRYYQPLIGPGIIESLVPPSLGKSRDLAHALVRRAMLNIVNKQCDARWQDIRVCHRLGRLVAHGAGLIDGLTGIAINYIASDADAVILEAAPYDSKRGRDCLRDLRALP